MFGRVLCASLVVASLGCRAEVQDPSAAAEEVEASIRTFWDAVAVYDFGAIDSVLTSDFEVLKGGRNDDRSTFIASLERAEAGGARLLFDLSRFHTEVFGEVGYARYLSSSRTSDAQWWEAIILTRVDGAWLIDRGFSTRIAD